MIFLRRFFAVLQNAVRKAAVIMYSLKALGTDGTLVYSIKTTFRLGEWAGAGCLGWPEFSSSNLNALFNQIQGVH